MKDHKIWKVENMESVRNDSEIEVSENDESKIDDPKDDDECPY